MVKVKSIPKTVYVISIFCCGGVQKKTEAIQHIGWSINRSDKTASFEFVMCLLIDHPKTIPVETGKKTTDL